MFRCFVIVLLICALFGAVFGSAATIDLDDVISGRIKKSENSFDIEEGDTMELTFATKHFINHANCRKELSLTSIDLSIQHGTTVLAVFRGEENHIGKWNCTFTRIINSNNDGPLEVNYNCSVTIRIKRPPEIMEVTSNNRTRMLFTNDMLVFDGKIGETKQYECKNKNDYGTIHWEFCRQVYDKNCKSSQSSETTLAQEVTLKEHNQGTVLKCVHTSNNTRVETNIFLYGNNPVSNPIHNTKAYYKAAQKSNIISSSASYQDSNSQIIVRSYEVSGYYVNDFTNGETLSFICLTECYGQDTVQNKIDLKSSDSFPNTLLQFDGSTRISVQATCYTQYDQNGYCYQNVCTGEYNMSFTSPEVFVTCYSEHNSDRKTITLNRNGSTVASEVHLEITKEGAKITKFKNGDILEFSCYDSKSSQNSLQITLSSKDTNDIKLKATPQWDGHGKKTYTARHKMDFTSVAVEAKCSSFRNNRRVINYTELTLFRIIEAGSTSDTTTDFFKDSSPIQPYWMWVAIVGGVLIIAVIIACIIMAFQKGKREEAMIQRASVNYEHFTNDAQEPTPPFPREAKLEQTYLAPVDLEESPYATYTPPDTDTYALPYTPSTVEELYSKPLSKKSRINALYSQVLPKSLRGKQNSSKYVNSGGNDELQYTEIGHKNKNYANVEDKNKEKTVEEDNYAEIIHRSDNYANLNGKKTGEKLKDDHYRNVFTNDPYVNAKRDDYAEPSYCELSRSN